MSTPSRRALLLSLSAVPVAAGTAHAQPGAVEPLTIRVAPTGSREPGGRAITLWQPGQRFHVVVTNVSARPVRLWREWCGWGYHALSFQVVDDKGKPFVVRKKQRAWRKNFPDWTELGPGDPLVLEVDFDESLWQDPPLPQQDRSRKVKMRAVYEVTPDGESRAAGVWTGTVTSPENEYTIYR